MDVTKMNAAAALEPKIETTRWGDGSFLTFGSIDGDDNDEGSVGLAASHQLVERFQLETSQLPGVGERCHVNLERMN